MRFDDQNVSAEVSEHSQKKFLHDRRKASHRTRLSLIINIARNALRPINTENGNFKTPPWIPPQAGKLLYSDTRKWKILVQIRITD